MMLTTLRTLGIGTSRWTSRLAAMAALALIAAACGSGAAQPGAEQTISNPPPREVDGVEYGDTLDEWSEAVGANPEPVSDSMTGSDGYQTLTWEDLVPPGYSSDEVYARYEDRLATIADGSPEANALYEEMLAEFDDDAINTELDGKEIQLAGFVAPLNHIDGLVTEFLLVPYFGACIHVPPPPPNQTIMVTLESGGLTIKESWGAVWVAGTLTATSTDTDLATASYVISGATSGVYDDY